MNVLVIALDAASPVDMPEGEVLVIAPALNSRLRRWLSDEDEARRLAGERADATVEQLERRGLHAHGQIGDADPMQAIADALPEFAADEIVIAGDPQRRPNLLKSSLPARARASGFRSFAAGRYCPTRLEPPSRRRRAIRGSPRRPWRAVPR